MQDILDIPQHKYEIRVVRIIDGKPAYKDTRYIGFARDPEDAMAQSDYQYPNTRAISCKKMT